MLLSERIHHASVPRTHLRARRRPHNITRTHDDASRHGAPHDDASCYVAHHDDAQRQEHPHDGASHHDDAQTQERPYDDAPHHDDASHHDDAQKEHAKTHRYSVGGLERPRLKLQGVNRSDKPEPPDRSCARGFAARERWAFNEAYRRYGKLLYSIAYNLLRNGEDAEDCLHDTLVRIWTNPNAYREDSGRLSAFLTVCVRNEALSKLRGVGRRTAAFDRAKHHAVETVPEIEIEDYVENRRLHTALSSIPLEQRTPLMLAYFEGKTHVQIADQLQIPLGTIKSRIAHGLRKLGVAMREGTLA